MAGHVCHLSVIVDCKGLGTVILWFPFSVGSPYFFWHSSFGTSHWKRCWQISRLRWHASAKCSQNNWHITAALRWNATLGYNKNSSVLRVVGYHTYSISFSMKQFLYLAPMISIIMIR